MWVCYWRGYADRTPWFRRCPDEYPCGNAGVHQVGPGWCPAFPQPPPHPHPPTCRRTPMGVRRRKCTTVGPSKVTFVSMEEATEAEKGTSATWKKRTPPTEAKVWHYQHPFVYVPWKNTIKLCPVVIDPLNTKTLCLLPRILLQDGGKCARCFGAWLSLILSFVGQRVVVSVLKRVTIKICVTSSIVK